MFPIRDVNPTGIRPVLAWLIIAVNVAVFPFIQPQSDPASEEFAFRNAAIACEVATGEPLSLQEIRTGVCVDDPGSSVVCPEKNILASVFYSMFLQVGFVHILFNM